MTQTCMQDQAAFQLFQASEGASMCWSDVLQDMWADLYMALHMQWWKLKQYQQYSAI